MGWWRDSSGSSWAAGLMTVLVGFSSSVALVFQAAQSLGASQAQISSWLWALGWGLGLSSFGLSWYYRMPIVTAWSTAGAAVLISSQGLSLAEAYGAFVLSAGLSLLLGFSGWLERAIRQLPPALGAAMLAGVLLHFGLQLVQQVPLAPVLSGSMLALYCLLRPWPRYRILLVLTAGLLIAAAQGQLAWQQIRLDWAQPVWVSPEFSWSAALGLAVPLWLVSTASQTVPGFGVLQAAGYSPPMSKAIGLMGLLQLPLAPLGAFSLNPAAITATLCSGASAHADPARRYTAAMAAGLFYMLAGCLASSLVSLLALVPSSWLWTLAGLALLGPLSQALSRAFDAQADQEAAVLTLVVTASGISMAGINSAFWGLMVGVLVLAFRRKSG